MTHDLTGRVLMIGDAVAFATRRHSGRVSLETGTIEGIDHARAFVNIYIKITSTKRKTKVPLNRVVRIPYVHTYPDNDVVAPKTNKTVTQTQTTSETK